MGYIELIARKLATLSPEKQAEIYDFVEFIAERAVTASWTDTGFQIMSLSQALRDLEDDPVNYTSSDVREAWR